MSFLILTREIQISVKITFPSRFLQVNPGSKAENSEIREGDIISEINGISVINHSNEEVKQLQKSSENGLSLKLVKHWSSNKKAKSSDSEGNFFFLFFKSNLFVL